MVGFGRNKNLPNPATNTQSSTTQDYLMQLGAPQVQVAPKKKKVKLDGGGQLLRGEGKLA
jgi:hypothetical protein